MRGLRPGTAGFLTGWLSSFIIQGLRPYGALRLPRALSGFVFPLPGKNVAASAAPIVCRHHPSVPVRARRLQCFAERGTPGRHKGKRRMASRSGRNLGSAWLRSYGVAAIEEAAHGLEGWAAAQGATERINQAVADRYQLPPVEALD